jgi:energy-coupling factor transport system permease protein
MEFAKVIEDIFYPLKIFKVEPKNIGIIISIALAFIPILKKELEDLKYLLKIKGFKVTFFNILKNISLVSKPFFVSILRKVNDLENTLLIKGYVQEN